jgi:cyanophycinase-like exopeptidase
MFVGPNGGTFGGALVLAENLVDHGALETNPNANAKHMERGRVF